MKNIWIKRWTNSWYTQSANTHSRARTQTWFSAPESQSIFTTPTWNLCLTWWLFSCAGCLHRQTSESAYFLTLLVLEGIRCWSIIAQPCYVISSRATFRARTRRKLKNISIASIIWPPCFSSASKRRSQRNFWGRKSRLCFLGAFWEWKVFLVGASLSGDHRRCGQVHTLNGSAP